VKTKYVNTINITDTTGMITITYNGGSNGISQLGAANTLTLTPNITQTAPLTDALAGNMDWACSSAANTTATNEGLKVLTGGSVLTKYVPQQCK
jgi:type IV pilus assembly protein PilA